MQMQMPPVQPVKDDANAKQMPPVQPVNAEYNTKYTEKNNAMRLHTKTPLPDQKVSQTRSQESAVKNQCRSKS